MRVRRRKYKKSCYDSTLSSTSMDEERGLQIFPFVFRVQEMNSSISLIQESGESPPRPKASLRYV